MKKIAERHNIMTNQMADTVIHNLYKWLNNLETNFNNASKQMEIIKSYIATNVSMIKKHISKLKSSTNIERDFVKMIDICAELEKLIGKMNDVVNLKDPVQDAISID